jgi:hypothetical protein
MAVVFKLIPGKSSCKHLNYRSINDVCTMKPHTLYRINIFFRDLIRLCSLRFGICSAVIIFIFLETLIINGSPFTNMISAANVTLLFMLMMSSRFCTYSVITDSDERLTVSPFKVSTSGPKILLAFAMQASETGQFLIMYECALFLKYLGNVYPSYASAWHACLLGPLKIPFGETLTVLLDRSHHGDGPILIGVVIHPGGVVLKDHFIFWFYDDKLVSFLGRT